MKKKKTTYGVYNYVEWHAVIKQGKAKVKVSFTGGSITTQGVVPATYTTSNPVMQLCIEQSDEFKRGLIKVVKSVTLKEEFEVGRNEVKHQKRQEAAASVVTAQVVGADNKEAAVEASAATTEEAEETEEPVMEKKEFEVNEDAKEYLEEKFGCIKSRLRTRADIIAAGKANGVEIVFV